MDAIITVNYRVHLEDEDAENIEGFYAKFGDKLPKALADELATLKKNLE